MIVITRLLGILGIGTGVVGAAVCLVAGAVRFTGSFYVAGFEVTSLFIAGTALMAFACMLRLYFPSKD